MWVRERDRGMERERERKISFNFILSFQLALPRKRGRNEHLMRRRLGRYHHHHHRFFFMPYFAAIKAPPFHLLPPFLGLGSRPVSLKWALGRKLTISLAFSVNVKKLKQETCWKNRESGVAREMCKTTALIRRRQESLLSNRTKKQKRRVRVEVKRHFIFSRIVFFFFLFCLFLICDAKELKHGAELLSLARSTSKRERIGESWIMNQTHSKPYTFPILHLKYWEAYFFVLRLLSGKQKSGNFQESGAGRTEELSILRFFLPETLTDVVLQFYTPLACWHFA